MIIMRNNRTTIIDAITKALKDSNIPLPVKVIFDRIVANDYYQFKAQDPLNVVRVELRRHSQGIDFPTASKKKYFQILNDGTYCLIEQSNLFIKEDKKRKVIEEDEKRLIMTLKVTHSEYVKSFKIQLLEQLKEIDPETFEIFCRKLLKVYGFKDLKVTKPKKMAELMDTGSLKLEFLI